jgi:DNA helicase-2/ATP-dependent DNA helicase PcrA
MYLVTDLDDSPLVNFAEVSGHDEHHPSQAKVRQWLKDNGDTKILGIKDQYAKLLELLKGLTWTRSEENTWTLAPLNPRGMGQFLRGICTTTKLMGYKSLYWREGTIDHDDVLYFAYRILDENPEIRAFLAARFRYLFIDEFQDTMPVQAKIVEWLAEHGTVVGVIGDPEQAIYGFIKCTPDHFKNFALEGHVNYSIADNRRSTIQIVSLLNRVRSDGLVQKSLRGVEGEPPAVYVGDLEKVIPEVRRSFGDQSVAWILARANSRVSAIRRLGTPSPDGDKWSEFDELDNKRALFMRSIARATEVARSYDLAKAVHTLSQVLARKGKFRDPLKFGGTVTEVIRRSVTLDILEYVESNYKLLADGTLLNAYELITQHIETNLPGLKATRITTGKPKTFAESTQFGSLLATVSLSSDENRDVRSIHQSKGAENDNVCVYLPNADQVSHLFGPDGGDCDDEERRITYVALSRAKNRLAICIHNEHADEDRLSELGLQVYYVN